MRKHGVYFSRNVKLSRHLSVNVNDAYIYVTEMLSSFLFCTCSTPIHFTSNYLQ